MTSSKTYETCTTKLTWSLDIQWCNLVCRYAYILYMCLWYTLLQYAWVFILHLIVHFHRYFHLWIVGIISTDEEWNLLIFCVISGIWANQLISCTWYSFSTQIAVKNGHACHFGSLKVALEKVSESSLRAFSDMPCTYCVYVLTVYANVLHCMLITFQLSPWSSK